MAPACRRPGRATSKLSNGMLAEVNSHDWDCRPLADGLQPGARLSPRPPTSRARSRGVDDPDFYDTALVSIRFESGALGTISGVCPCDYGYDARVEIVGEKGIMQIGELQGPGDGRRHRPRARGWSRPIYRTWPERFAWGYIREMEHFVDCIRRGARAGRERHRRPLGGRRRACRNALVPGGAAGAACRGPELMRAAVYHGPGDLRVEDRARPRSGRARRCSASCLRHLRHRPSDRRRQASPRPARHDPRSRPRDRRRDRRGREPAVRSRLPRGRSSSRRIWAAAAAANACPATTTAAPNAHALGITAGRRLRGISVDPRCGDRARQRHPAGRRHRSRSPRR